MKIEEILPRIFTDEHGLDFRRTPTFDRPSLPLPITLYRCGNSVARAAYSVVGNEGLGLRICL